MNANLTHLTLRNRIEKYIQEADSNVFIRKHFAHLGERTQVNRVLRVILKKEILIRAGYGIYVRAKKSSTFRTSMPLIPLLDVGMQALAMLGVPDVAPVRSKPIHGKGARQRKPGAPVLNVGKSRISRQIGFGKTCIQYEKS